MRRMASVLLLLGCTSGCIFTHTWELQTYPSWIAGKNRPYEIVQEGGVYYTMSWLETKYEHHIFTDKAGFTYDSELNPLIWVPQLPFIWLCEVPFRWLWEDYYAYRVPVKVDKRIRDKQDCRFGRGRHCPRRLFLNRRFKHLKCSLIHLTDAIFTFGTGLVVQHIFIDTTGGTGEAGQAGARRFLSLIWKQESFDALSGLNTTNCIMLTRW